MTTETLILPDAEAVAAEAAERFAALLSAHPGERFSLALSGGSTPQRLHRLLTQTPWIERIDWSRVHIFLADERQVPHDHPDSNYRMARETLLDHVPIPPDQIHPVPTAGAKPAEDALAYADELAAYFGSDAPAFDLILLGMGPDGHTASLFPGHTWPQGGTVIGVENSPKPPPRRISLSLEFINRARNVLFLVTGADKAEAVARVFSEGHGEGALPAGRIQPAGKLVWLLDQAAAARHAA
ncbi:6-phosphogluconolactonase [Methylococcus sp. EFPC2]|uniref:6-phosphogluconolactonase n=1 Tax=Methylococcus sp. EFPC2 TaxID=2812648 RepID=UPI001966F782|nr:6-phosphogluconolactonase [Methylococcus sp. EFPC2]QSA96588.1 6-phosphogluconolactonase [Methylococcus sp. EFPC2]